MKIDHLTPGDWAHHDPSLPQRLLRALLTRPGRLLYRYRGYGHRPRVPQEGGFLLAPGPHGAFADPFIFSLGQERTRLRFMAKYQALEWPVIGRIIRWAGGFPVHRGSGRSADALAVARTVIESGEGVVMFMEGTLVLGHDGLGTPRNGLARLALQTGAPVVPVAAWGAKRSVAYGKHRWSHWPQVTAVWGEPIRLERDEAPSDERVAEVRELIWAEVLRCFDQAKAIAHAPGGRPPAGTVMTGAVES
jgi:1-acyl-sn-glycerol-3-phosphate acyltransferase